MTLLKVIALICLIAALDAVSGLAAAASKDRVKDIIIFQVGGWTEWGREQPGRQYQWPVYGGKSAYVARSEDSLKHQMRLVAGLGPNVAVGILLMTDLDSIKSGYGACWNGAWNGASASCEGGEFLRPFAMYDHAREAARSQGVRYAPNFSLMNYDGTRGAAELDKLKNAIAWLRQRLPDPYAAKSPDGRYYVIIDSLPKFDNFTMEDKSELLAYMHSQQDLIWIDNLVDNDSSNNVYNGNVFRSAAAAVKVEQSLNDRLKPNYLWWAFLNRATRDASPASIDQSRTSDGDLSLLFNISPHDSLKYPVIISQWNEYAESLTIEPTTVNGDENYKRLRDLISKQP